MRAAVVIDPWKLPIFQRHLSQAGYAYEVGSGLTEDTLNMYVETDNVEALASVLTAANIEAAGVGRVQ